MVMYAGTSTQAFKTEAHLMCSFSICKNICIDRNIALESKSNKNKENSYFKMQSSQNRT